MRRAGNHHRTLTTYLNAAIAAGFTVAAVAEPPAGPLLAEQNPLYTEVPIFFAARYGVAKYRATVWAAVAPTCRAIR